jgi:hypothetical protein
MKKREQAHFYSVPELKEEDSEEIPVFKVKSASLDDQIKANELSMAPNRLLIRLLKMIQNNQDFDTAEFRKQLYYDDLHPKTIQACEIFQRCVIQPKFKIEEVFKLTETHPDLVNDVAAFALGVRESE